MACPFDLAPTIAEMEQIARAALAKMPEKFLRHLDALVVAVEEIADDALLADMGIDDPYALTGVYEGLPLTERSVDHSGTMPDRIRLYRLPILLEWCERGDVTLDDLVTHVIVHEVGHHFGLSDADMHALEQLVS